MTGQAMRCSSCQGELGAEDVNLQTGLAKCHRCNKVFRLEADASLEAAKEPVSLPSGMSLRSEGTDCVIERRWFGPAAIFLLIFCILWDGFLFGFAQGPGTGTRKVMGLPLLFVLPHFYVGLGLSYFVLCLLFNKTVFRVNSNRIQVRIGPFPAFGNRTLSSDQVEQLYCRKVTGNKGAISYRLMVLLRDGKSVAIGGSFQRREQVIFLEQQIEQALGITDRWVEGEDRRGTQSVASLGDLADLLSQAFRKKKPPQE